MIIAHIMNIPGGSSFGWFKSPRVTKIAYFTISGSPMTSDTWTSRWGDNRPEDNRSHDILSEIQVRVQHQARSGAVEITVTGDSEAEVDSYLQTVRDDVNRSYNGLKKTEHGEVPVQRAYLSGVSDTISPEYYWRQKYLGLLIFNVLVLSMALMLLYSHSRKQAQQVAASDR